MSPSGGIVDVRHLLVDCDVRDEEDPEYGIDARGELRSLYTSGSARDKARIVCYFVAHAWPDAVNLRTRFLEEFSGMDKHGYREDDDELNAVRADREFGLLYDQVKEITPEAD